MRVDSWSDGPTRACTLVIPASLAFLVCSCGAFAGSESSAEGGLGIVAPAAASEAPPAPAPPAAPVSRFSGWAAWNAFRGDPYELDAIERRIEDHRRKLVCNPEAMVSYRGTRIRYAGAVTINPHFRERLERFEEVVSEVAVEVYGRPPRRLLHHGAYSCRSSRNRNHRLSEHALGNAIDVVGFDFGPATKDQVLMAGLPKQLRGSFQVRVARYWNAREGIAPETHARFLRLLLERLQERRNVFRGLIVPGHPGHDDHFHFDMSPWRYMRP